MKLSRKFDIFTIIITIIFISVFLVSNYTIKLLTKETSRLSDISRELDYLTQMKKALNNLSQSIEHYLHIQNKNKYKEDISRDLSELEKTLNFSEKIYLDDEEKEIVKFGLDNFKEFSGSVENQILLEGGDPDRKILIYENWKNNYIEKMLAGINKHWNEDLEKVDMMTRKSLLSKEKALWILLITATIMFFIVIASRLIVSKIIVKPIRTMEDLSNAIAQGETGKRIKIRSDDELGRLSKSINMMADAIEDKLKKLQHSIAKEQSAVREQTILNELMAFIASGVDLELVLRTFLGRTRDLLKAEHSAIFLLENLEETKEPVLKNFFNTFEEKTSFDCANAMLSGVFKYVFQTFTPLRINSLLGDVPATHFKVKNLIAIPLSSIDKKILGLIVVTNKEGGFTEEDEDVLFNFSFQAFQAITMQQEIVRYATTDGLTGLNNHRIFMERLEEEAERSKRYSRDLSLLMIDIDHFKSFNDIYGHQAGDYVLKNVAKLIAKGIRATDFGARYGGEEFVVILPETAGSQAMIVAERLRSSIGGREFTLPKGDLVSVTVSVGCASSPEDADAAETLIKKADQALYFAKESGRNRVSRYYESRKKTDAEAAGEIDQLMHDASLTSVKELAKAIDAKSNYMKGHSFEVAALSIMIGKQLELDEDQIDGLRIASLLHDVGNLGIPDTILNKPSPLSEEEKKIIQGHPGLPEMLLKHQPKSEYVLPAILYHHERYDGKGYPLGLQGDEIPFSAKILGVVEAYQAMISPRPYRKRKSKLEAIAELENESGRQFDPLVVRIFVNLLKKIEDPAEKRKEA